MSGENRGVLVGVGVYLFNDKDQLLLGKRSHGQDVGSHGAAGGHLEFGETWEEAAIREIDEELGISLKKEDLKLARVFNDIDWKENLHYISIAFCARIPEGQAPKIMEPDKCESWDWHSLDKLPHPLFVATKNLMKEYNLKDMLKLCN